jgi:uncharacterized protein (DUF1800 family)
MDMQAAQALVRFGLGRRGEETPPADPHAWLTRQLAGPDPARFDGAPSTVGGLLALRTDRQNKPGPGDPSQVRDLFRADAAATLAQAIETTAPFRERLVWFWTNHFTVSLRQGDVRPVAGAFMREAIRPYVTGHFSDMLLAVMRHPAMLMYLDNTGSVGPNSLAGMRQHRGLNENLARECLELHTVSPAAGYSQADVTAFANILTGWSIELKNTPPGFLFRPNAHEPGDKVLMGRSFPPGEQGGVIALAFLAAHPSTHRFLATKLVRHFVADDPPPDAVRRIEGVLRDTGGNLGAASAALVAWPSAWQSETKLRSPQDFLFAALRAADLPPDKRPDPVGTLGALGQPLWNAPLPNGWPDRAVDWAGPEAMLRRIDWSWAYAGRLNDSDPSALAENSLGPLLRPATADAIRRAGSRREALALLIASPEFQRR